MTCYACLFEAKSIQDYILRSGRLRHIVGASELIDSLSGELLGDVLTALKCAEGEQVRFSRRAGGAIYLFSQERSIRDAFRDLWTLVVRQYAPGLEFVLAIAEGESDYQAFRSAAAKLLAARNRQAAVLPAGGPVTVYAPRTGNPAITEDKRLGWQDAATGRFGLPTFMRSGNLTRKFSQQIAVDEWPRNLEYNPDADGRHFPFLRDNRYLALLHADGNGLGQLLMSLSQHVKAQPDTFIHLFSDFSRAVDRATQAAATQASEAVLLPARLAATDMPGGGAVPARPIVLGGDDLTLLIRADLALPFTQAFLQAFEQHSRNELDKLKKKYPDAPGLPDTLTAGAGIAFVKSNHPFHLAHGLAESLASHAKGAAKALLPPNSGPEHRIMPTLSFHRVTSASHGDYTEILQDEMTFGRKGEQVITTLGAYTLDAQTDELPKLADLQALAQLLGGESMARGPARQLLTLLGQDHDDARRRYARWREVMAAGSETDLERLDQRLTSLCGKLAKDLPVSETGDPRKTPLGDAAMLLSIAQGTPAGTFTGTEENR
jgi:hypothetical protein